uniref:XRE family transcriptional regulator n=1 Tax=Thermorudis peleae TaxID=1382356 RepID=A0A831X7W3_9BACT
MSRVTIQRGSPGGARLRALRERLGRTQLWVELEAGLGTGYLQRVESGRVVQPSRETVERILDALGARFSERREIMELFGYRVSVPLPSEEDIRWARDVSRAELDAFPFPAYVLDCTTRLLSWNGRVPDLFAVSPRDPTLGGLAGDPLLVAWFDPASRAGRLVAEPDTTLLAMIYALRHELAQFYDETWCQALLARLLALPRFREYWQLAEQSAPPPTAARALIPLRLTAGGAGVLSFRLASEPFTRDTRFRVIYFFPDDLQTMKYYAAGRTEHDGSSLPPDQQIDPSR